MNFNKITGYYLGRDQHNNHIEGQLVFADAVVEDSTQQKSKIDKIGEIQLKFYAVTGLVVSVISYVSLSL